jgi:CO/xanthine dehydrogenase FAD-binding subunit
MRSHLPAFALQAPALLAEAFSLLAVDPGLWRPFAGGTDLMVMLEAGTLPEGKYLGLWKLRELRGIRSDRGGVSIGALTTYTDLLRDATMQRQYPLLCRAAAETGGIATQNRGTVGGNIANASPAADTPPALLVYDAEIEVASVRGTRRVPYHRFHLGYKKMDLAPDEIITRLHLPPAGEWRLQYYRKVGTRRAQAISKVCLAAVVGVEDGTVASARVALNSVAPTVVRAYHAEAALQGRPLDRQAIGDAVAALRSDLSPIDDLRSTARYRARVAERLLVEALDASLP